MAIVAYTGLPGAGKSYAAVANQVIPALRAGRTVCTNIPLQAAVVSAMCPAGTLIELTNEAICNTSLDDLVPHGAVFVADECWQFWPSGGKDFSQPVKDFFAKHRHRVDSAGRSMQIVLVTQDLASIAPFLRRLVDQTFIHHKHSALGADNRYRVSIYTGGQTGLKPPKSQWVASRHGKYEKEVTSCYRSHTQAQTDGAVDESKVDGRGVIWRSPVFVAGLAFCGLGFPLAVWGLQKLWIGDRADEPDSVEVSSSKPDARQPVKTVRRETGDGARVSGIVEVGSGGFAVVVNSAGFSRLVPLRFCEELEFGWQCAPDIEAGDLERLNYGFGRQAPAQMSLPEKAVDAAAVGLSG